MLVLLHTMCLKDSWEDQDQKLVLCNRMICAQQQLSKCPATSVFVVLFASHVPGNLSHQPFVFIASLLYFFQTCGFHQVELHLHKELRSLGHNDSSIKHF